MNFNKPQLNSKRSWKNSAFNPFRGYVLKRRGFWFHACIGMESLYSSTIRGVKFRFAGYYFNTYPCQFDFHIQKEYSFYKTKKHFLFLCVPYKSKRLNLQIIHWYSQRIQCVYITKYLTFKKEIFFFLLFLHFILLFYTFQPILFLFCYYIAEKKHENSCIRTVKLCQSFFYLEFIRG